MVETNPNASSMEKTICLTIDGREVRVPENTTILDAAASVGIHIPTLCYWRDLNEIGACRVCVCEVEGYHKLFAACNSPVEEGLVVHTNSRKVLEARRANIGMILAEHNADCPACARNGSCKLQSIARDLNIRESRFRKNLPVQKKTNPEFPLIRDYEKCIKCMRCVQVCEKVQCTHVWDVINTGSKTTVDVCDVYSLEDSKCALCGQCITHCPVGALTERDDTERALDALYDPDKITVVSIAPSIRTAWGEPFGLGPDEATVKRLVAVFRKMGFDYIFDTNFSADLTIMEEGSEFLERLKNKDTARFPMFTSCCPGWVRFVKSHYPEFVDNLSTAKSPQQMFGAITKSYYADLLGVDPHRIVQISVMPCLAKKHECAIPAMNDACGDPDVDIVLTTREVERLIRQSFIHPAELADEEPDMPLGIGSGAGNIFGATGGVMEAALRSAYYLATGKNPEPDAFREVRAEKTAGWRESTFDIEGTELRVAVASGLGNADRLLRAIQDGEASYDFVEIMACPGGCVGGGGQPICDGVERAPERAKTLYAQDAEMKLRFSHENPSITAVYQDYLGAPLSEKAHHLLHTDHHAWSMPGE